MANEYTLDLYQLETSEDDHGPISWDLDGWWEDRGEEGSYTLASVFSDDCHVTREQAHAYVRLFLHSQDLLAVAREALHGLYVEHAENCHDPDCSYVRTYEELSRVIHAIATEDYRPQKEADDNG